MNPIIIAISSLSGIVVGGIIQMLIARYIHVSNERMSYRKLAVEAGLENWRMNTNLKMDAIKHGATGDIRMDSPDSYISHMLGIMDKAGNMSISASEAASKIHKKDT